MHTFTTLMRRLARAGFKKEFVKAALLPDWWDESCAEDPSLLKDIEIRVARFLLLPLAVIQDVGAPLTPHAYPGAQLRRVRDVDRDRLAPAIHSALRIAAAVVRSLRQDMPDAIVPPSDGLAWREQIERSELAVTLDDIGADLWQRGIPVVPVELLPAPAFQGMACIVENRPVVLLCYKYDEPGRVAWLLAHEVAHLTAGHCGREQPVVDEEEEISDDSDMERSADEYAARVLLGTDTVPEVDGEGFKELARRASQVERNTGADASAVIFAYARRTGDYPKATMAVRALYRDAGARRQLRELFEQHVDLAAASETDLALLRCVQGS